MHACYAVKRKKRYMGYKPERPRANPFRSCVACAGLERFQPPLFQAPFHSSQSGGMDSNGTCDKMEALLRLDVDHGDTWIALQRWTGVYAGQASHWEFRPPEVPRHIRYCRDDPEKDAQIARDVASMPRRPPPKPGPRSTTHGRHSGRAIRNVRLPVSARMPHSTTASLPSCPN